MAQVKSGSINVSPWPRKGPFFCLGVARSSGTNPQQPGMEVLKVGSSHMGIWVVDGLGDDRQEVVPLLISECRFGLVLVSGVLNGGFDRRQLTGWQFIDIVPGSSSDC